MGTAALTHGLLTLLLAAAQESEPTPRALTFVDDVAPILWARCVGCHRAGQAGPFALTSHAEVAKRAASVADVVARGLMPPWLPVEGGGGPFVGERRLSSAERTTLLEWLAQGAPSGDLTRLAPLPEEPGEWRLGEPDLVLTLASAYQVPSEGRDVYRNFVLPFPLAEARFVRALEFEPDNPRVLHHASIGVDGNGGARALDARDAEPGFPGMGLGGARLPDGHFLGWAPGKSPDPGQADMAWRLAPGDDLVLQMHLRPSGKPETIRPRVGLYFSARAPTLRPVSIILSALDLDIPAGVSDYVAEREYRLPVAAAVRAVYPHAHYLGRELRAWARLPDGRDVPLIRLDPWDFDWQDSYRFVEPVALPAGTLLCMRYSYDNSSANPYNPHSPPRRVRYGEASTDEMGELLLQLLPAEPAQRELLERDFARHLEREKLALLESLLAATPGDARLLYSLALAHERLEEWPAALEPLRALVRARPRDAQMRAVLGRVLVRAGELDEGEVELTRARAELGSGVGSDPKARQLLVGALVLLGDAYRARGEEAAAQRRYAAALELEPTDRAARARLVR